MFVRGNILLYKSKLYAFSRYTDKVLFAYPVTLHDDEIELATEYDELPDAEPISFTLAFNGKIYHSSLNRWSVDQNYDLSSACFLGALNAIDSAFLCGICGNQYQYETYLRRHMRSHQDEDISQYCTCCTQRFDNRLDYLLHRGYYSRDVHPQLEAQVDRACPLQTPNGLTYYHCVKCSKKFRTADDYLNHTAMKRELALELDAGLGLIVERKNQKPLLLCNSCLFPAETVKDAIEHLKLHYIASAIAIRESL